MSGIGENHNYDPTDEMNLKALKAIQLLCFQKESGDISYESLIVGLNAINLTSRGLVPQDTSIAIDNLIGKDLDRPFNSVSMYQGGNKICIVRRLLGASKVDIMMYKNYKESNKTYNCDGKKDAAAMEEKIKFVFINENLLPIFQS